MIPLLAKPGDKGFLKTREGLRRLAREIVHARPDTIVIASPHNLRLVENIAIVVSENSTGNLRSSPRRAVNLKAKCDVKLARRLLQAARTRHLPVVGVNYGTFEGPTSDLAMDWGTLVPLWFVLRERRFKARIIIVTPSREIPMRQNAEFGSVMARVLEGERERFVFIASADQAHTHKRSGPYGFSPAGSEFDRAVLQAIESNELSSLMDLDSGLVEDAKPDSPWQMAMLAGILQRVQMRPTLFSYEVPTYYGMICAGFEPTGKSRFPASH